MKKQSMDGQVSLFNTQKSFLEKSIENLSSMETTNGLTSFSKIEKTCAEKISQTSTQYVYVGSGLRAEAESENHAFRGAVNCEQPSSTGGGAAV